MLGVGDELFVPPHADRIKVFQSQSNEIEAGMAGCTLRFLLVQVEQAYERLAEDSQRMRSVLGHSAEAAVADH